jgi:citrate synthase
VLLYRGYPIEQLAEKSSFMEVSYLLLHGELPNKKQLEEFDVTIRHHTMINETLLRFFNGFPSQRTSHGHGVAVVASMSAFYHDTLDIHNPRQREIFSHRIVAKIPTIAAAAHKHSLGQPFIYPRNDLDYCSNMLHMFFAVPCEPYKLDPVAAQALDLLFVLHADHEQNASTSTCASPAAPARTLTRRFCGVSALWGPAHGGANERCSRCSSRSAPSRTFRSTSPMAKDKSSHFRLMASGIASTRISIRARRSSARCATRCCQQLGSSNNPLFELALRLEEIALKDEYFVARKLYPNVDFIRASFTARLDSAVDVHRDVCDCAHGGVGGALAGDDFGSCHAYWAGRGSFTPGPSSATTSLLRSAAKKRAKRRPVNCLGGAGNRHRGGGRHSKRCCSAPAVRPIHRAYAKHIHVF